MSTQALYRNASNPILPFLIAGIWGASRGGGNVLTSMITVDAVDDLGIKQGDQVSAVIKSTEVMLAT